MATELQRDFWWRRSKVFTIQEKEIGTGESTDRTKTKRLVTVARPSAEFWYSHFWKPRESSAWAYELVRNWAFAAKSIPQEAKHEVQGLRSYPELNLRQKQCLQAILRPENKFPVPAAGSSRPGYTDPLPPIAFNLRRGLQHVLKFVSEWYQAQERFHGKPREFRKTGLARNKDQTSRLGDWSLVEVLSEKQSEANKDSRHYAITRAKEFYPLVRFAMRLALSPDFIIPSRPPVIPSLTGKTCSAAQRVRALKEACRKPR